MRHLAFLLAILPAVALAQDDLETLRAEFEAFLESTPTHQRLEQMRLDMNEALLLQRKKELEAEIVLIDRSLRQIAAERALERDAEKIAEVEEALARMRAETAKQ